MARMRSLKPEFWSDEELAVSTSRDARLLYAALWNLADEHSRLRGDPRYIKGQVFAYDDDLAPADVDDLLGQLAKIGKVVRYRVGGAGYLFLPNLAKHQRLDTDKVPSRLPAPPVDNPEPSPDGGPDDPTPVDIDGNGRYKPATSANTESGNFPDQSESGATPSDLACARSFEHVAGSKQHAVRGRTPAGTTAAAAAEQIVIDKTDAMPAEATAVVATIRARPNVRNLPGLVDRMAADGDLAALLAEHRGATSKTDVAAQLAMARDGPPCEHGTPGGASLHPTGGEPLCPNCRVAARHLRAV